MKSGYRMQCSIDMCILYKIANIELITWIALLIFYLHGHNFLQFSNRCSLFQTHVNIIKVFFCSLAWYFLFRQWVNSNKEIYPKIQHIERKLWMLLLMRNVSCVSLTCFLISLGLSFCFSFAIFSFCNWW
jgi:hypothetical protein